MAEIKIEKKAPVWPWIVLTILLVAAFVYYLVATNKVDVGEDGVHINKNTTGQIDTTRPTPAKLLIKASYHG